jgi:hypothetical protein
MSKGKEVIHTIPDYQEYPKCKYIGAEPKCVIVHNEDEEDALKGHFDTPMEAQAAAEKAAQAATTQTGGRK